MPYQFSCFLPTDPNFIALKMMALSFDSQYARSISLQQCYGVAAGLIDGTIARTPAISAHHICQYVEENYRQKIDGVAKIAVGQKLEKINGSRWWIRMKLVTQVGHHEFYV